MRDHTPTPAPLPIDTPDEPPPLTEWSPGPSRFIAALLGYILITVLASVVGMVAGFGLFAAVILGGVLAIVIGIVWLTCWPDDAHLAQVLRWWL
jgi:hypothetical protein